MWQRGFLKLCITAGGAALLLLSLSAASPRHSSRRVPASADSNLGESLPAGLANELRIVQGFKIAPVPLNLDGKNPILVGLGSYLVNSCGCNDCHTAPSYLPGGDPFQGQAQQINVVRYLGGGQQFGPDIVSRNLTPEPDEDNKPAGMGLDEFIHVLRTGEDLDQKHPQISPLLQVMPWPRFRSMTNLELTAIYEYLGAIPSVDVPGAH